MRLELRNSRSKNGVNLQDGVLILVGTTWPKEAFQTILPSPGYNVNVEVWYALTDAVINGDERPFCLQTFLNCMRNKLNVIEEWSEKMRGQINYRLVVLFGDQQAVSSK